MAARTFGAELEREKISQRTHEHLLVKARKGLNVGGRVYGYSNVEVVKDGDAGTQVWFRVGDDVARGEIRGRGGPLNGAIDGLGEADIFETEAEARAAR